MDKKLFEELVGSIKEAGAMKHGKKKAARKNEVELPVARRPARPLPAASAKRR